ncbi:30S ribosomal protein S17 [Vitis vinifera]|uniref:30S ribosomal protein S17 n=1 Tax=Vitis vinifera TaxID=29760 RepID=A0A438IBT2_VITVI|nr:30S ribosomal protein S17 [Vitis vinifera]
MKFKAGRGTKIMFWTDHWCGNEALSQAFPQIFALAVCSNESVNDVWDPRFGQGGWNLRLVRDSNDWELVLIEDLLFLLRGIKVTPEEDSVLWKVVRTLWEIAFALFGVQWVFPEKGRGVFFTSRLLGVGSGPLRAGEVFLFLFFWPCGCFVYLLSVTILYRQNRRLGFSSEMKPVVGMVVSNKMQKSVVVAVDRLFHNKLFNRYVKRTSKFMAHDEHNLCNIGDRVSCWILLGLEQAQALGCCRNSEESTNLCAPEPITKTQDLAPPSSS